ncbi:nucleotidyltransferase domain-containing protein [Oscillatoria sp. CS-180]|uniref:nucleotidyltransferase family protein n=1 Tax=Oscillatoria sp. CS-180 TaxID=3021720 RepID=UPI00232C1B25|nr:nucleotidyltransferase domain-containing protein [Oscillatoria sp. CS-180]MDB9528382.1 nucleotidyltransferase domain-containing protein [Oscillatoria sp. CS-180]
MATFPTPLLDEMLAKRQQQAEQERQQLLEQALQWLSLHGEEFGITSGFLFGSVTQPDRFSRRSDIDLAIESLKIGDPFGLMSYLSLHIDREVDLVPLDQCHFSSKIRRDGILWKSTKPLD